MAMQIKFRNGTASTWTSTNPTLAEGEKGVETDTGQFKIGDGTTVWTSLAYKGITGPAQTGGYRSLGDGSDGNVSISSGVTTLTRDMYYNNLTVSSTGQINTANFKIFVKGNLDLTAAGVAAINNNGTVGGAGGTGVSGGAAGVAPTNVAGTLGVNQPGAGGAGSTTNGATGGAFTSPSGNGGGVVAPAAGGNGGTGTGGTAGASVTVFSLLIQRYETNFLRGISLMGGGLSASGGGGGGGDNTFSGGGGGSGGAGGGAIVIYANNIIKSSSTVASCIQSLGGMGGAGGNGDPAGNTGGGGGGSGGGGGWIAIYYNNLFGPTVANMLDVSGGQGGIGGTGFGTGLSAKGGAAGLGGNANWFQIPTAKGDKYVANKANAANNQNPEVLSGAVINNIPSLGGLAQISRVEF